MFGIVADLGKSETGIFTKPFTEYKNNHDRRSCEESNREVLGLTRNDPKVDAQCEVALDPSAVQLRTERKKILAGQLAIASCMSIAMFAQKALKGMMADIPLALTEGLENLPKAYGDTVRDQGPVTGFRSGATVAGKTFAWGFIDGISDVVVKPYQETQKECAKGAAKGLGKGLMDMTTKTGAGMFGVMGCTITRIAKSTRKAVYTKTRTSIANAKHVEGGWLVR